MAKGEVRTRMAASAARLLAEKGVQGTSFAEVLAAADAPRGSTYHHFPEGKGELIDAALDVAGRHAMTAMEPARGRPPVEVVRQFLALWRHLLTATDMRSGCAVLAVTVDAGDAKLIAHAGEVFRSWRSHLASLLVAGGMRPRPAARFAATIIASTEGAVVLARAEQSFEPFDLVESYLIAQARAAVVARPT